MNEHAALPQTLDSAATVGNTPFFNVFTPLHINNWTFNWPRACRMPGVAHWFHRFYGTPCIIVSAGPSLERNLAPLAGHQRGFIVLCVDNAYNRCYAAGVRPDVTLTVDAQPVVGPEMLSPHRPGDLVCWVPFQDANIPEIVGRDDLVCYTEELNTNPIWSDIQREFFSKFNPAWGCLAAGGTISTVATSLAFMMGCSPIIHVGLDLCYYDKPDAYPDAELFPAVDIWGRDVFTIQPFWLSRLWYSHAATQWEGTPRRWINATGAGLLADGYEQITDSDFIPTLAGREFNTRHYLRQWLARRPIVNNSWRPPRNIPLDLKKCRGG